MSNKKLLQNAVVVFLTASFCCALWGSAFPFVKIGYSLFGITSGAINSQILFAGMRYTIAGILTLAVGSILSKKILVPATGNWMKIINLSLFQTIIQYVFFYIGISNTTGVKSSIVVGSNALVSLLVASLFFHQEKLTTQKIIGCVIGFAGVIVVNLNKSGMGGSFKLTGEGFIFLSTVSYAIASVLLKKYAKYENVLTLNAYQFLIGGVAMMTAGFVSGGKLVNYTGASISILLYLGFLSSVTYCLWGMLLKYNPVSKVSVYGFMTPVFGVWLSAWLLKENKFIGYQCIIALLLVCVGIYIVNYNKPAE